MATFQIKTQQWQQQQTKRIDQTDRTDRTVRTERTEQTERTAATATTTAAGNARTNLKQGHKSTDFGIGHWQNGQHKLALAVCEPPPPTAATTCVTGRQQRHQQQQQQQQQQEQQKAKHRASDLAHDFAKSNAQDKAEGRERKNTHNLLFGKEDGDNGDEDVTVKKRATSNRSRDLTPYTRTFTSSCYYTRTARSGTPLSCSAAFSSLANIFRLDASASLIMLTMLAVATVVISGHGVYAAQRDGQKAKDIDGTAYNANAIASMGGSGNGNLVNNAISDGNSQNISMPPGVSSIATATATATATTTATATARTSSATLSSSLTLSTFSAAASSATMPNSLTNFRRTATTSTTTTASSITAPAAAAAAAATTTITTTTTTTGRSMASGNLQKTSISSLAGTSGINRNSIELVDDTRNGPFFDKAASKNVTALLGKTAYLNCRVKNLGNKTMLLQVSWVRHRDIHLLTVGRYTYTSDQRFRAIHQPQTEDWILQIKYPQHRDSGIYECQVSSTPHMSHYIHLNVVEPTTEIIGAPDLYIESGSTINLTCVILNSPEPPAYIFWNHNNAIINYDSPRGGVSVVTNKGETTTSFLLIKSARPSDSGHYQCNPSNSKAKSVTVHVLNGEFPAAMQHAAQAHHLMSPSRYLLVYLFVCLCSSAFVRHCMQPSQVRRGTGGGGAACTDGPTADALRYSLIAF